MCATADACLLKDKYDQIYCRQLKDNKERDFEMLKKRYAITVFM
jgi:hypothetical protein